MICSYCGGEIDYSDQYTNTGISRVFDICVSDVPLRAEIHEICLHRLVNDFFNARIAGGKT